MEYFGANGIAYAIDTRVAAVMLIRRDVTVEDWSDLQTREFGIKATARFGLSVLRSNAVAKIIDNTLIKLRSRLIQLLTRFMIAMPVISLPKPALTLEISCVVLLWGKSLEFYVSGVYKFYIA